MHVILDRRAFVDSLAWLRRKRAALPKASLTVFKGQAQITCGPLEVGLPYVGDWQGVVTFDGGLLRALAKSPPLGETVEIRYTDGRVFVGAMGATASLHVA